jgi:WD40 repeat protein
MWLICEQIFKELKKDVSTWLPSKLTNDVKHALKYGFVYLLESNMIDRFFWLADIVVTHYHSVVVGSVPSHARMVLMMVLQNDLKLGQNLRVRISWHFLVVYDSKKERRYLESVLYRSPKGLFTDDEKKIAKELMAKTRPAIMPVSTTMSMSSPLLKLFGCKQIAHIGVSSVKNLAAVAFKDGTFHILSLPDLFNLWQYSTEYKNIPCCTFAPDDSFILFGKLETVLDIGKKAETSYFHGNKETFNTCAFSASGNRLATGGHWCRFGLDHDCPGCPRDDECSIKLWDVIAQCILAVFQAEVCVDLCRFSTTGLYIIVHSRKGDAYSVWNCITFQRVDERTKPVCRFGNKRSGIPRSERCNRCVSQQGKELILLETVDDELGSRVILYGIYNEMECAFYLYAGFVHVIERTHLTTISVLDLFLDPINSSGARIFTFTASEDDHEYLLLSIFSQLILFSFKRVPMKQVLSSPSHHTRVIWCAFSPDSTRLATCTSDGLVNIWNVDTCDVYQRFRDNFSTDEAACCWLSEYLFVCHVRDGILSLSKYPVGVNFKIMFTQREVVLLYRLGRSDILDFADGYLCFVRRVDPVIFVDVRRPENGSSGLILPGYTLGMTIKILNGASFLSGSGKECIVLWKRKGANSTIYEVFAFFNVDSRNPVYCFSDDLRSLVVSKSCGSIDVVDVVGRDSNRERSVQNSELWRKAFFVDNVVIALISPLKMYDVLGIFHLSTGEYRSIESPRMCEYGYLRGSKLSPQKKLLAVPGLLGNMLFFQLHALKKYSQSTQ